MRAVRREWYERGRDKGLNLDLEVAIELARLAHARAAREVFAAAGAGLYLGMVDGLLAEIAARRGD